MLGQTHVVLSPVEFLRRLAALIPPPRLHTIRYHGLFAPNAKLRPLACSLAPGHVAVDEIVTPSHACGDPRCCRFHQQSRCATSSKHAYADLQMHSIISCLPSASPPCCRVALNGEAQHSQASTAKSKQPLAMFRLTAYLKIWLRQLRGLRGKSASRLLAFVSWQANR
jgi:hypothetical protein